MPEIILNGIPVRFPFEPYEVQKKYMTKVIESLQKGENAVLESPTGTGKTLCLLCATLAWLELKKAEYTARRINAQDNSNGSLISSITSQLQEAVGGLWKQGTGSPKIIFSSRTHSQLSQVVKELKKTTYTNMKVCLLGSRDQMCIHPDVSKEPNNNTKVHMCQARVKARTCYFYNQVDHKKLDIEIREKILDLEDLVQLGKKRTFCPYYMAREIRQDADIIFMPYNYLLDPKSRRAHGIELQGNIVIFDEAHNIEKMCEDSASLQIRSTDLALCIEEITQVMQKLQEIVESEIRMSESALIPEDFSAEDLYILKTIFLELEKAVDEITLPNDGNGVTYPGEFMFKLLEKADITPNKKTIILDILEKLIQYLTTNSTSPYQRKGAGLQKFSELIKIVFSKENFTLSYMDFVKQCYKVHVNVEEKRKGNKSEGWGAQKLNTINAKTGKVLSYWCFNPGFGMKDLAEQGVQSIVLTSGTLSPLDAFTSELQIPFPIKLENPHIIKASQVWVGSICKGPDGTILNSSYENRSKPEYINSLGQTILTFSRVIPGGLLVFFPSYPIMKMCQENWQNSGLWSRLYNIKPVFVEPQSKDGFLGAMQEFYLKVRDPTLKGACFMAVCRGKVSEGLDFADRNGRAVIITGLPFPPFKDPRVVLKQKYLEEIRAKTKKGLTGSNWYKLEASRAVNQAIGRVIRHKDDYGAIILCDKRFGEPYFKSELSTWVKPHMQIHEKFGPALREIIQFFRTTASMFPDTPVERESNQPKPPVKIEYESTSGPSSKPVVLANAFEMLVGRRQVNSTRSRVDTVTEKAFDTTSLYRKDSNPLSKESKYTTSNKSLFKELEKKSSILDFNKESGSNKVEEPGNLNGIFFPKKKKIKLVRESEKELNHFINSQSAIDDESKSFSSSSTETSQSTSGLTQPNQRIDTQNKQNKIAKYIKEVKEILSKEEYKNFSDAVKEYKTSLDCDTMIAKILSIFASDSSRHSLLIRFSVFLRPEHRNQLEAVYNDIVSVS